MMAFAMPRAPRRRPRLDPTAAVACVRVSTSKQELSPEAQRAEIEAWSAREGVRVVAWHDDTESGGNTLERRAGLLEALADVEALGAGVLVFQKIDRFTRSATTAALVRRELERVGARLAFADGQGDGDDPTSNLVRTILVGVAEFERELVRARTKAAAAQKRRRGESWGMPPFGFRAEGGRLVPDEREQAVIRRARELRAAGLAYERIIAELGPCSRAGTKLSLPTVWRLLNPRKEG